MTVDNPTKILVIKSETAEILRVEVFIKELFKTNNIPVKFFNKVFLCISEAVINSIEHGNKNDCKKEVSIFVDYDLEKISVEIIDEGDGFNINKVANPTKPENIKKESGRGLHIIKSLSDHMEYKNNRIRFKIECK